jgi:lysophospholipase L1-like esterase
MFKSKSKERLLFAKHKTKHRNRLPWFWTLVSVLLSLAILELVTRIFIDLSGKRSEFAQATSQLNSTAAYRLKFVNEDGQPYQTSDSKGVLVAQRSLSVGYQLAKDQNHQYWQINDRGFRDSDSIPVVKPKDEIRIILLGNSTAFGYGSSGNEVTIGELLEARLQKRIEQQISSPQLYQSDLPLAVEKSQTLTTETKPTQPTAPKPPRIKQGKYRVINAAVPGYASGNQLAQLALQLLNYKPDLVIAVDGYSDLMLTSSQKAIDLPELQNYLAAKPNNVKSYVSQVLQPLEDKSYVVKIAKDKWLDAPDPNKQSNFLLTESTENLVRYLPQDDKELQARIDRYAQNHKQILALCAAAKIPLIVASQPEITGRDPSKLTPQEGSIVTQLGRSYIRKIKDNYPKFIAANQQLAKIYPYNVKAVDLYSFNTKEDNYPTPTFIDEIHLTDEANQSVADRLYYAISAFPKMQVVPKVPTKPLEIKK